MKLPFRAPITFALGAGLILIVMSITAFQITINSLIRGGLQEVQTQEVVFLLDSVTTDFKTTESLQRRYLLTNATRDLAAYERARTELQQTLPRIAAVNPTASERQDWQALQSAMAGRIGLMDKAVLARQQEGLDAAAALVGSDLNQQLHTDIENLVRRIKSSEIITLRRSEEATSQTAQTVKRLSLVGGLVSLSILAWAVVMIGRSQARQQRIQTRLADSEAMSRAITDSMAEGVVTATQEGVIVTANSAARHLFGYQLDELVGRPVAMLLPARYQPGFISFFSLLSQRRRGFRESDTQVRGQRRDGTEFPVNVSFGDVDVGGRRLFTAIIRDITESKRIAEALRDSEAQLRQLTDSVPALIAYVDRNECFQFHNRAYEEVFGLTFEQIHGKTMLEVMGPELYAKVQVHVRQALSGYAAQYDREHVLPSGERREYVMSYFPRYGEEEEEDTIIGFFSLGTDVSELKRIDRMKSEFVSTVSHELRTPLTSIRGSLGLVWGGVTGDLPEKAKGLIGIAKNNCERLIRLINDILDSEKIESGKMNFELQSVELMPLLEQALVDNQGLADQHKIKLNLRAAKKPVSVHVDSDRLLQVVTNLLSNAIKFSPPEGVVDVAVRTGGGRVRVEVIDKGPGIPEAFRRRIFQKFSQADSSDTRQKGGTGLGLNISKAIIERMDGTLDFRTADNAGTTFYFELPEWREAPPVTAPMSLYGLSRPRVLVCEDDPDVAQLIGMMLDKGGFDADVAHTAGQARDYLKMETYAAMTVDIKLPYESGLDLIRELREEKNTADLPVLVLSVTAAEARLHSTPYALRVSDWLDKPIDEKRLLQSLQQAIDSRNPSRRR